MAATSGSIRAGKAFVEIFTDNTRLLRGLKNAQKTLKSWGTSVKSAGRSLVTTIVLAATPFALAAKVFADFDDKMRAVKGVTGATGAEFDMLTEKAKELGRTTSFTASQVGEGMLNLGRAGFSASEIDAAIAAMMDLSRATGTELGMSADIAASTLRSFGLEAARMTEVADVLTATANGSAQTLEDLGEAMKMAAPIAVEAGMNLQDTAKAIGTLANFGIKGTMAGTGLRQIMLQLANVDVQDQLKAIGVQALDATGNLRPVGDVLKEVGVAMQGMPNAQRMQLLKDQFGQRAAGAAAKLGQANFQALFDAIDNAGGKAASTAKEMDAGLGGAFRIALSAVEGVALAIGEALAPVLTDIASGLQSFSEWLTTVSSKSPGLVQGVVAAIAAIGGLGVVLVVAGTAMGAFAGIVGGVAAAITTVGAVASALGTAFAFLASWPGIIAAGLVAAGLAFVAFTETGQQTIQVLTDGLFGLKDVFTQTFGGIVDALMAGDLELAGRVAMAGLRVAWAEGLDALGQLFGDKIKDMAGGLARATVRMVNMINGILGEETLDDFALGIAQSAAEGLFKGVVDADLKNIHDLAEEARKEFDKVLEKAKKAREDADAAVAEIPAEQAPQAKGPSVAGTPRLPPFDLKKSVASVTGTFSSAALSGLGAKSPVEDAIKKTEKNTKKAADGIDDLVEAVREGGLTFA